MKKTSIKKRVTTQRRKPHAQEKLSKESFSEDIGVFMPGLSRADDSGSHAYVQVGMSLCTGYTVLRMMDCHVHLPLSLITQRLRSCS